MWYHVVAFLVPVLIEHATLAGQHVVIVSCSGHAVVVCNESQEMNGKKT